MAVLCTVEVLNTALYRLAVLRVSTLSHGHNLLGFVHTFVQRTYYSIEEHVVLSQ